MIFLKRYFCTSVLDKYLPSLPSSFGLVSFGLFYVLLSVFLVFDMLSISLGNVGDITEWFLLLKDGLLLEGVALSLLGVLLINPWLISQVWRTFYYLAKVLYGLALNSIRLAFTAPSLRSSEHSAHGCRAPPSLLIS
jgi:hypothetical protein